MTEPCDQHPKQNSLRCEQCNAYRLGRYGEEWGDALRMLAAGPPSANITFEGGHTGQMITAVWHSRLGSSVGLRAVDGSPLKALQLLHQMLLDLRTEITAVMQVTQREVELHT